jgi:hypothetical protein
MSGDYTEVTSQGWFSRIMDSIKGVLIGLLLFVISFPLLGWNEFRAVKTQKSLEEGAASLITVDPKEVDKDNDGKFVHFTGQATTDQTLKDAEFDVSAEKALRLVRKVEMYQWNEEKQEKKQKKLGGGEETVTTYSYTQVWADHPINSESFNPKYREKKEQEVGQSLVNPPFPFDNKTFPAKVTVGKFTLPKDLADQIKNDEPLAIPATAKGPSGFIVKDNQFFKGAAPDAPKVGDVRVSFTVTKPAEVSVYGRQNGDTLEPYKTKAGDSLIRLEMGAKSGQAMIESAQSENRTFTWILRLVGFILMAAGIYLMVNPLVVIADVVPFIGSILGTGALIFAIVIALPLTLLTIGVCWLAARPLLGGGLLLGPSRSSSA